MELFTVQYNFIKSDIMYPNKFESENQIKAPNCYKKLFEDYKLKTGIQTDKFIWCFKQLYKSKDIDIKKDLSYMFSLGITINKYVYCLDVPETYIVLTSFYDWVSIISREEDNEDFLNLWENIYLIDDVDVIQAVIPYIKKSWIKHIYNINDLTINAT